MWCPVASPCYALENRGLSKNYMVNSTDTPLPLKKASSLLCTSFLLPFVPPESRFLMWGILPWTGKEGPNCECLFCTVHTVGLAQLSGCALCWELVMKRAFEGLKWGRRETIKIFLWRCSQMKKGRVMTNKLELIHNEGLYLKDVVTSWSVSAPKSPRTSLNGDVREEWHRGLPWEQLWSLCTWLKKGKVFRPWYCHHNNSGPRVWGHQVKHMIPDSDGVLYK